MKRIILTGFACVALMAISSSCKKNWVCRCNIGTTYETTAAITKKSKKQAKEICEGDVKVGVVKFSGDNGCYLD